MLFREIWSWLGHALGYDRTCKGCEELEEDLIQVRNRVACVIAECEMAETAHSWPFKPAVPTGTLRALLGVTK